MAVRNHITEKNPPTGALPAEQTAKNARKKGGSGHVWQIDKLVYQLVENNVKFAEQQFISNLKINSETLAEVLYDNIFKILGDKLNEDEFAKKVADELLDKGVVVKNPDDGNGGKKSEPKEEVVYELDDSEYRNLVSEVDAAVQLLKASKLSIFKAFSQIDDESASQTEEVQKDTVAARLTNERKIEVLVEKLHGNQIKLADYISHREESNEQTRTFIDDLETGFNKTSKDSKIIYKGLSKTFKKIGQRAKEINEEHKALNDTKFKNSMKVFEKFGKGKEGKKQDSGTKLRKRGKIGKPGKFSSLGGKIKTSIQSSGIWKIVSTISRIITQTLGVVKKVVGTAFRVGKKIAKAALKTAKIAGKAFLKTAQFIGNGVQKLTTGAARFVRGIVKGGLKGGVKGVAKFMNTFSGANILGKIGWKAIKFIGKSIWAGIKKLAKAVFNQLKKMFKFGGKFVNKASTFIGFLTKGIGKAYVFMVKPMANILVTVFGFVTGILKSPVDFMKFMVPTLLERTMNLVSNIKQYAKSVLRSTWGIFKKILFNPITLIMLIGGLFLIFGPKIIDFATSIVDKLVFDFIPFMQGFVQKSIEILTPIWEVLSTVGGWLFSIIEWITNPDNFIMRAITGIVKFVFKVKSFIKNMCKAAGASSIDFLCMWIAGDTIGLALHTIVGSVKKLWNMIKDKGPVKTVLKLIKFVLGIYKMIWSLPIRLVESIGGAIWAIVKGDWGDIPKKFTQPWKEWWDQVASLFKGDEPEKSTDEILAHDPLLDNQRISDETSDAVNRLGMKGMNSSVVLEKMDNLSKMNGYAEDKNMLSRIHQMTKLYKINSGQVAAYDIFLSDIWKMAGGKDSALGDAQRVLEMLLEDPDFSEKILSVFFYYNPQTGETMQLWPMENINKFIGNLQMMMATEGSWRDKFKMFVDALDQLNKERSHIVNNQGTQITKFANSIQDIDLNQKNSEHKIRGLVNEFNKGNLFKNISAESSFDQMRRNNSKTQKLKGKSGETFGGQGNTLISKSSGGGPKTGTIKGEPNDFTYKKRQDKNLIYGNVQVPSAMTRSAMPKDSDSRGRSREAIKSYEDYLKQREDLMNTGKFTQDQLEDMGFGNKTLEQWLEENKSPEQRRKEFEVRRSRIAALRNATAIDLYQREGKQIKGNPQDLSYITFDRKNKPSIYSVEADLTKTLFMFSDDWVKMTSKYKVSDETLELLADGIKTNADDEIIKKSEHERQEKLKEEKEKAREKAILDYSAQLKDGYIEIKVGEDVIAMEEAYDIHNAKRDELLNTGNYTNDQLEEMNLKFYTWEEWKKYYRKTHGLPENGIRRIPFKGAKKKREIDWNTRYALATEEIEKYGIEMSKDGPVMIPLAKAMQAAGDLFKGAEYIHSIRDGLEVMRLGLDHETEKLKKDKQKPKVAVAQTVGGDGGEVSFPIPANPSSYQEVG